MKAGKKQRQRRWIRAGTGQTAGGALVWATHECLFIARRRGVDGAFSRGLARPYDGGTHVLSVRGWRMSAEVLASSVSVPAGKRRKACCRELCYEDWLSSLVHVGQSRKYWSSRGHHTSNARLNRVTSGTGAGGRGGDRSVIPASLLCST